jgi:hypothetical protein
MTDAGFKYIHCWTHGMVITRRQPCISKARMVGLENAENSKPGSRLCDYHSEDGTPIAVSQYAFAEATKTVKKLAREKRDLAARFAEARNDGALEMQKRWEEEERQRREEVERQLRRSDRLEHRSTTVTDRVISLLGRAPTLSLDDGAMVDQLLHVIENLGGQVETLQERVRSLEESLKEERKSNHERLEEERKSNSRERATLASSLAIMQRREHEGAIRSFIFSNELRYNVVEDATGVSANLIGGFFARIVQNAEPSMADPASAVMWFFAYFRRCLSHSEIATRVGVARSTVAKKIREAVGALSTELARFVSLPSIDYWVASRTPSLIEEFPKVLPLMIDATPLPIFMPTDPEGHRAAWNHKASATTLRWYAAVLPDGEISWSSELVDGSANDLTMFTNSPLPMQLSTKYQNTDHDWELAIFGDKGYRAAAPPRGFKMYLTESARTGCDADDVMGELMLDDRVLDTRVCKHRFVVERVFGQMKNRWRRLSTGMVLRSKSQFMEQSIGALCAVHNLITFPLKFPEVYADV